MLSKCQLDDLKDCDMKAKCGEQSALQDCFIDNFLAIRRKIIISIFRKQMGPQLGR